MTKKEIIARLKVWKAKQEAIDAAYEKLRLLTGCQIESELSAAIFFMADEYTSSVSELIGDEYGWLSWYQYDCEMGKNPKIATLSTDAIIEVKTLAHLARVIAG